VPLAIAPRGETGTSLATTWRLGANDVTGRVRPAAGEFAVGVSRRGAFTRLTDATPTMIVVRDDGSSGGDHAVVAV